ncbi:MAG: signal peptidase I [Phycisphaeraceae bacterium]|nr:signal peptidase I [Phycisphaeraceae bacterium]
MSQDAEQPNDAPAEAPKVHTATLSEPKANPGAEPGKGKKLKKPKKERPEPETAMGKLWHNWVKPIGTVIIIVVVFRSMLLDWNDVPTGSMEPEIHVGDRIAVNRLAYGLQFPLTGPQIGIPFTPVQFDNPLDGIPQINWGSGPSRGDIVTFWNPVTSVRMVKRIVAVPGDTIAMNGGQLTINGEAAGYTDLDAVAEGLPLRTKWRVINALGKKDYGYADLEYRSESLLGLTRTVQHIEKRWLDQANLIEDIDGSWDLLGDTVEDEQPDPLRPGIFNKVEISIEDYLAKYPLKKRVVRFESGTPLIDGKEVSHNQLASVLLKPYESGERADVLDRLGLGINAHELLIDGEPVPYEFFSVALEQKVPLLGDREKILLQRLDGSLRLLGELRMTSFGPVTIGEGEYFMVGDNRNNSHDSRFFGPVKRSEITGKAFAVAFSFEDNKMFALPPDPAWSRFFKDLD